MVQFWICWVVLFAAITGCGIINVRLNRLLVTLIPWLLYAYKPALITAGKSDRARNLSIEILPYYYNWYTGSLWYGTLVFVLQCLMTVSGIIFVVWQEYPYILIIGMTMLLGSMIMFFPRTFGRWRMIKAIFDAYLSSYMLLLLNDTFKEELKEKANDNTNPIGTDSHT